MTSLTLNGAGTALVTPFTRFGTLDLETWSRLVARQVEEGIDFIVPCGTTGEAVTLALDEYEAAISLAVSTVAGRVPVVAGAGSNSTEKTIETAKIAAQCGADAILVVGPYYNKPTQEGFYQHFRAVAEAVPLPMVIYNVPGRTGSNMSADTQLRIAELDTVIATKEASANFSQLMQILRDRPEGFAVLSGDDNLALAQIVLGADGVISVLSNEIPGEVRAMIRAALDGRFDEARRIHYRTLELSETNFIESSPIPVKAAMAMMGLLEEVYRLPLVPIGEKNRAILSAALRRLGLIAED